MDTSANKQLAHRLLEESLSTGDLDGMDEIVAADYVQRNPSVPPGREGLKAFFAAFRRSFPDLRVRIERSIAEDDMVAVVSVGTATHRGEFSGLPPTGRSVEIRSIDVYRIVDGLIAEHYGRIDELGLLEQLGVKHDLRWPGAAERGA